MHQLSQDPNILYVPDFLNVQEADRLQATLTDQLAWRQDQIRIYGRTLSIPRLQCFVAEPGVRYTYSGLTLSGEGFPAFFSPVLQRIFTEYGLRFNALLANLYRDGNDTMGWHSDDEPELGDDPIIASVTLGAARSFKFRPKSGGKSWGIELEHGSLLLMGSGVQSRWQHSIPKRRTCHSPRINLTFRRIFQKSELI